MRAPLALVGLLAACSQPSQRAAPSPSASAATIAAPTDPIDLVLGAGHACRLSRSGRVACWGRNDEGQLGDGTVVERPAPTNVNGLSDVIALAAGATSTCAVRRDGAVLCWGAHPTWPRTGRPTPLESLRARSIALTRSHWIAVTPDGAVRTSRGPLEGHPLGAVEVRADAFEACTRAPGALRCFGLENDAAWKPAPRPVEGPSAPLLVAASAIAAGREGGCAIVEGQPLVCWNADARAYLLTVAQPRSVAMDADHACAVAGDGRVACWGKNRSGELGSDALGLAERSPTEPVWVTGIDDAERVALGGNTTCVLRRDGRTSCWGSNDGGVLGPRRKTGYDDPVLVEHLAGITSIASTMFEVFALGGDGKVQSWGGYEPAKGAQVIHARPRKEPIEPVRALAATTTEVCGILKDGTVRCRGGDDFQRPSPGWVDVPGLAAIVALAGDGQYWPEYEGFHSTDQPLWYALDEQGALFAWTVTEGGRLGPATVRGVPKARSVGRGKGHTCVVHEGGTATCWPDQSVQREIVYDRHRTVTPHRIKLVLKDAERVVGPCVLRTGGPPSCFHTEEGPEGKLHPFDVGSGVERYLASSHGSCVLRTSGELGCPIDGTGVHLEGVTSVAAGLQHACASLRDGTVRCWGSNGRGAIGQSSDLFSSVPVDVPRDR